MGRFDSCYLFSDVDGTLMTSEYTIPQVNIDALRRFTREGGHFALATGRGVSRSTFDLLESLPVNAPCVLLNGALLYDGEKRERLACFYLPPSARDMVERLLQRCPTARFPSGGRRGNMRSAMNIRRWQGSRPFIRNVMYFPIPGASW